MAERPAIQFYFGDWKKNQKLRFCSWGARGVWIEVMGLMHDSTEYGVLRQPLKAIAQALGAPMKLLHELVAQGVMYGCASGPCEPMVYRPKHAGGLGEPVVLVAVQPGPIWYSPRMVRDEYKRTIRGSDTRFKTEPLEPPKPSPMGGFGDAPKSPPNARQGDGASASSSSSKSFLLSPGAREREADPDEPPPNPVGVIDGQTGLVTPPSTLAALTTAQGAELVKACKALRAMGSDRAHPGDEELAALMRDDFTAEQLARVMATKALRDAGLLNDPDAHPDLLELAMNGAPAAAMGLTAAQHASLRGAARQVSLAYLASTLRGRRRDATNGSTTTRGTRRDDRPRATDNLEGKTYRGTPDDKLPPELRAAIEGLG
ncbi:hypothetical protein [Rhodanobacter lindaniclasticus]